MPFMIALAAILVLVYAFCYVMIISTYTYARVYVAALFNVLGRPSPAASSVGDDASGQETADPVVDVVAVPGYFHERRWPRCPAPVPAPVRSWERFSVPSFSCSPRPHICW
jgi:hypothetical protein